jgi:hypothetical protein
MAVPNIARTTGNNKNCGLVSRNHVFRFILSTSIRDTAVRFQ